MWKHSRTLFASCATNPTSSGVRGSADFRMECLNFATYVVCVIFADPQVAPPRRRVCEPVGTSARRIAGAVPMLMRLRRKACPTRGCTTTSFCTLPAAQVGRGKAKWGGPVWLVRGRWKKLLFFPDTFFRQQQSVGNFFFRLLFPHAVRCPGVGVDGGALTACWARVASGLPKAPRAEPRGRQSGHEAPRWAAREASRHARAGRRKMPAPSSAASALASLLLRTTAPSGEPAPAPAAEER